MSEPEEELPFSQFYLQNQRAIASTDMRRLLTTPMACGHFQANEVESCLGGKVTVTCVACKGEQRASDEARRNVREELRSVIRYLFNLAALDVPEGPDSYK